MGGAHAPVSPTSCHPPLVSAIPHYTICTYTRQRRGLPHRKRICTLLHVYGAPWACNLAADRCWTLWIRNCTPFATRCPFIMKICQDFIPFDFSLFDSIKDLSKILSHSIFHFFIFSTYWEWFFLLDSFCFLSVIIERIKGKVQLSNWSQGFTVTLCCLHCVISN